METQTIHHQPPSSTIQRQHSDIQHMFEKPLTPSDVGKLNRLVIPKQHAENYFPVADQQTGLVLCFEDECGKLWRFRYSYWNSSQSYVLTKGWSRYVKEKQLDAGDVVLFHRHVVDCHRMFIRCRRRATEVSAEVAHVSEWGAGVYYDARSNYPMQDLPQAFGLPYQPDCLHAGEIYENVDTYQRRGVATRRLRLFGVNLECPDDSEPSTPYGSNQGGQSNHHHMITSHEFQVTSN